MLLMRLLHGFVVQLAWKLGHRFSFIVTLLGIL